MTYRPVIYLKAATCVVTPWCSYDEQNARVSVVYNDHSLYIWDVRDVRKVGKSHSFLFHSACIWGLEVPYFIRMEEVQVPYVWRRSRYVHVWRRSRYR